MALLRWAALAAAALMLVPATALALPLAAADPAAAAGNPGLRDAAQTYADIATLSRAIGSSARPGDALLRIGTQGPDAAAPALPPMSLGEALAALRAVAGVSGPEADSAPPAPLADALAPVVAAAAVAASLSQQAVATLRAEDQAFLWSHILSADALEDPEGSADLARVEALAARVDIPRIQLASAILANAMAAFQPPTGPSARAWQDPTGLVVVGGTGDDTYGVSPAGVCDTTLPEPVLIVDLGGNDFYCGHPASYFAGLTAGPAVPVRAILEVGGNDRYDTYVDTSAAAAPMSWGEGVGIGGIGLLVDRWGDDTYYASPYNAAALGCAQTLVAQGVGALGVGAIVDASGNDAYFAQNQNVKDNNLCHFGWVYTFAQGVALTAGVGTILDATGDDKYAAYSASAGKADNLAHVYAQGAAAAGALAVLLDEEGHDLYAVDADAQPGGVGTQVKGDFAYIFAQGATFATRLAPSALPAVPAPPGLGNQCFVVPLGTTILVLCVLGGPGSTDVAPSLAVLADFAGRDTFSVVPRANDLNRGCSYVWAVSSAQGSAAIPASVAALLNLDVSDADTFRAAPRADGKCGAGVRALSYGQGFGGPIQYPFYDAPYPSDGAAFGLLASAGPVRAACARAEGNGTAGAALAPLPGSGADPLDVAIVDPVNQLLARDLLREILGPQGIELPGVGDIALPVLPSVPGVPVLDGIQLPVLPGLPPVEGIPLPVPSASPCQTLGDALGPSALPGASVLNSPDSYSSTPVAVNNGCWGGCVAQAESWVQGSAARETTAYVTYHVLGLGLNLDVGGDDAFLSQPCAYSVTPSASWARSVAQGASASGVGALVNVGGDDTYNARPCGTPGVALSTTAQGTGDGRVTVPATTLAPQGAPIVTPPLPVVGPQQVDPENIKSDPFTPGIAYGDLSVQVPVPGFSLGDPVTTPAFPGFPSQTVDPFGDVGTPADTVPAVGIIIDLSGDQDWYSQASGAGPLVPCYGGSGFGPNGMTLGSLWPFGLLTDAHVWSDDVPTTCAPVSTGWGLGMDWASDLGI